MASIAAQPGKRAQAGWDWNLYGRWIGANALAELIGLGGSLIAVGLVFWGAGETPALIIGGALMAIALGTLLEGVLVGWLQWRVLRRAFAGITRRAWITATALGAGIAWTLGMLPSSIMSLAASGVPSDNPASFEPEGLFFYAMAAGMALVFAAMDIATKNGINLIITLPVVAAGMLMAGAAVGAVHGIVLVWLSKQPGRVM